MKKVMLATLILIGLTGGLFLISSSASYAQNTKAVHYDVCGKVPPNRLVTARDAQGDIIAQTRANSIGRYTLVIARISSNPMPWTISVEGCDQVALLNEEDFQNGTCTGGMGKHKYLDICVTNIRKVQ